MIARFLSLPLLLIPLSYLPAAESPFDNADKGPKPLKAITVAASSELPNYPAANVADGIATDASRWVSLPSKEPIWIELTLPSAQLLTGLHVISGYMGENALRDFVVQFWRDGNWVNVPSADVTGNKATEIVLAFDATIPVKTDRIRLWITGSNDNTARVSEIRVWPASVGNVPPLPIKLDLLSPVSIFLNQSGFNSGAPKRFTAPAAADGAAFTIRPAAGGEPVFKGTIQGNIGDFTAFEPASGIEYVVTTADGKTSVPFRVGPWWLERVTTQLAVDFMIDSRHYVGNERRSCGGSYGWRDDHHFGWELHTLVPQWLSNPSAYARLPRQITYEAPKNPKLWGKLQPPSADAPDLVKLIHWGADIIVTQNLTHELLKSQIAYFLYAWPALKDYLPAQNYEVVRDFAFANWATPTADRKYPYDESHGTQSARPQNQGRNHQGCLPAGVFRPAQPPHARGRQTREPPRRRSLSPGRHSSGGVADRQPQLERSTRHQGPAHERVCHRHRPRPASRRLPRSRPGRPREKTQ